MKKTLAFVAAFVLIVAAAVWLCAWRDVARLRASLRASTPVARTLTSVFVAIDPNVLRPHHLTWSLLTPPGPRTMECAPTMLGQVLHHRRRTWLERLRSNISGAVVSTLFTPEEILQIYVHDSLAHPPRDLTAFEAATLVARMRRGTPEMVAKRRDYFLARMAAR